MTGGTLAAASKGHNRVWRQQDGALRERAEAASAKIPNANYKVIFKSPNPTSWALSLPLVPHISCPKLCWVWSTCSD